MSEKPLSEVIGIDQAAEEALARANVRSLRELREAEAEALAMASGIPLERIKDWQQRARRAGAPGRRNPVVTGWMVAIIGLIVAALLGWGLMSVGAGRIQQAEQTKVAAEAKLETALTFAAAEAVDELRKARLALHNNNWGSAQTTLSRVEDYVTFMEQVSPEGKRGAVAQIREAMGDLQGAVGQQSADAGGRLDALEAALAQLSGE